MRIEDDFETSTHTCNLFFREILLQLLGDFHLLTLTLHLLYFSTLIVILQLVHSLIFLDFFSRS